MEDLEKVLNYVHPSPTYEYSNAPEGYTKTSICKGEYEDPDIKRWTSTCHLPPWVEVSILRSKTNNDDVSYMVEALSFQWVDKDFFKVIASALSDLTSKYVHKAMDASMMMGTQVANNIEFELHFDMPDSQNPFSKKPVLIHKKGIPSNGKRKR